MFAAMIHAVTSAGDILVFRPRPAHWLPLLIPMGFPMALGVMNIAEGTIAYGLAALAFAVLVVGYNGSTKLTVGDDIAFSRYGRKLWQLSAEGVEVRAGRTGEIPILPALVLFDTKGTSGAFPKSMLTAADIARVRVSIELRGGRWVA